MTYTVQDIPDTEKFTNEKSGERMKYRSENVLVMLQCREIERKSIFETL